MTRLADRAEAVDAQSRQHNSRQSWTRPPTIHEQAWLAALAAIVFLTIVSAIDGWLARALVFGDSQAYAVVARAIREWEPGRTTPLHFWGLPYLVALASLVTGASTLVSLLFVSAASSVLAVWLINRLWGGWAAALMIATSYEWLQRSLLGGAEPVFMALMAAAFLLARRRRWELAALCAAIGTTVRPQGIFALAGLAVALIAERDIRRLVVVTLIGAVIGVLYVIPFYVYFGDPLANFHVYQGKDWHTGSPISIPLVALVRAMFTSEVPWTAVAKQAVWVAVYSAGVVAMVVNRPFRTYMREHLAETTFTVLFLAFLFSYNSYWSLLEFARYALPILPIIYFALQRYLPLDRRLLWVATPLMAAYAALSALNVRAVLQAL